MTLTTEIQVREVAADEAQALASLTWTHYRPLLTMDDAARREIHACCLAAWLGDIPVGLVTSAHSRYDRNAQSLLSLVVAKAWRRQGIGRTLLRALERAMAGRGLTQLQTQYSDRLPDAQAFGQLIQAEGWPEPEAVHLRICGPVRETFSVFRHRAGILQRLDREGFRIRTWAEDGERALAHAVALLAEGAAPGWADPRPWLDMIHPDASMVLITPDDHICGWVMCQHQVELSRWYFPVGWVQEPQAGRGWLLGAYAEGARRLAEAHGDETRVVVESSRGLKGMWRVLERHFVPYADWSDRMLESIRPLA
jgi:GNAT superfamily N-acetyltransferase